MRYRLVVVAPRTAEVVRFAGGWLFDRAMAGWDVTVLTADHTDPRPLRILGARAVDLEDALATPGPGPRPQAVAVRADLYRCDARVRRMVLDAAGEGRTEVRLWGERWPAEPGGAGAVRHRLSAAARAFKAQALAAAAVTGDAAEAVETFRRGEPALSVDTDLVSPAR
jgi:hypothetical protein